ncbi:uncharacterized protein KY384_001924 [Bacidia gigantensis]|uniref:uncharacterized protein n=1 Tax=Bacidia gigantensis TaxID=2732470 RepID=UPI001D04482C|nr:uncharacterized protein KY384_001924 [Bacidia gigantensis]KAG8533141.1 hypothetical protein KY384_001924 [Bacidia gigantensis]
MAVNQLFAVLREEIVQSSQQNATAKPLSQLFTTDLTTPLQKCGDLCCPGGMKCQGTDQCVIDDSVPASSSAAPSSTSSSTAAPSASSAKGTPSPSSKPSSSKSGASPTNTATNANVLATAHCNQFATPGVLVGFFSGLAAGIITTILCICCIGRTRSAKRDSGDLSSVQASVSDPIYNQNANAYRTDFLRHGAGPSKAGHRMSRASSKVKSYFSKSPTVKSGSSTANLTGSKTPRTPKTPSSKREPSMESIRIYSPPNMGSDRPGTSNTTWAEMMSHVGLKENEPYIGSPGRVDPRSRRLGDV